MRKLSVLLLTFIILLSGCKSAASPAASSEVPEAETTPSVSEPAVQTSPSTEPAILPTEPSAVVPDPFPPTPELQYLQWDYHYRMFLFEGERPDWDKNQELDLDSLKTGGLYTWNAAEKEAFLITMEPLKGQVFHTRYHLFFVTEKEPNRIIRSDYEGKLKAVLYQSHHGDVEGMWYHGADSKGKLLVNEDGKRIVEYDIPTGITEILLEKDYIGLFGYDYNYELKSFYLWWNDEKGHLWTLDPVTHEEVYVGMV